VQRNEYDPWGSVSKAVGNYDPTHRFNGKELDPETGLYYYGGRYYDPEISRFISPDPFVPEPGNPQALNRYSYTINNPQKYIDPTGYFFLFDWFKKAFKGIKHAFQELWEFTKKAWRAVLSNPVGRIILAGAFAVATYGAFTWVTGAAFSGTTAAVAGASAASAQAVMEIPPLRQALVRAGIGASIGVSLVLNAGFNYAYGAMVTEAGTVQEVNYKNSAPPQDTADAAATFKGDEFTRHPEGSQLTEAKNITHEIRVNGELRAIARVSDATGIPGLHAHVAGSGLASSVVSPPSPLSGYGLWGISHQQVNINFLMSGLSNTTTSLASNLGQWVVFRISDLVYGPYGGGAIFNPAFKLHGKEEQK
jgi:RHS repeat-associated protein